MKRQFFWNVIVSCTFALCLLTTREATALMCGMDLNDDGDVLAEGELATCTEAYLPNNPEPQAFCPVQAVDCTQGTAAPICPEGGVLNPDREICQVASGVSCPDPSYIYNSSRNRCEKPPVCPGGYLYDSASGQCLTEVTSCTATAGAPTFSGTIGTFYIGSSFYTLQGVGNTITGTRWSGNPTGTITATSGPTFSGTIGLGFYSLQGVGNTIVGRGNGTGTITATSGPTFSGTIGLGSHSLQGVGNTIVGEGDNWVAPFAGTITATNGTTFSCPIAGGSACTGTPSTCIALASPTCPGGTIDQTNNVCFASSVPNCPSGYTYNGSPVNMCETAASCVEGVYNPESNQCVGEYSCPLENYACLDSGNAVYQCSPNPCFDPATTVEEVDDIEPVMMQSDGDVDEEGQCLDHLFIFSGSKSRCRPPGLTVGKLNNCCESDEPVMSDSKTGNRISSAVSGVTTAYEIGQVAYYGSALATGTASITAITGTTGAITSMTVVTAGGATTTLSGAAATGAYGAMASGATTTTAAVGAGMQSYAAALFNPATIAFAAAAYVAVKVLMGGGCDEKDIMTSLLRDSGNCHYLGNVCERKWPIVGCVQKAKRYCCFNSKMARIIHEQGRPQLLGFAGLANYWGTPKAANCRGFTTDEFQMLDFSKIDMSAYFADMQAGLQGSIEGAQQKALDKVQQHYDQTQ